jgi:uncharacterized protein (TIGR02996 family)
MSADALLQSVLAATDDDLPRLVYADWLDEHADPARADFIRTQIELAKLPAHDPRFRPLEDREHDLLGEHEAGWLGEEAERLREWEWRRGFVDELSADIEQLERLNSTFREQHPFNKVRCSEYDFAAGGACFQRWMNYGWPSRMRALDVSGISPDFGDLTACLQRTRLPNLTEFDYSRNTGIPEICDLFWHSPVRQQLAKLSLGGRSEFEDELVIVDELVECFADSPVSHLSCFDAGITSDGLRILLSSPFAATLKHLDISDNPIAPDAYRAFQDSHPKLRLDKLDVSGTPLAGISLEPLLHSRPLEALTRLEMNGCGSARRNMEVLAKSPFWTQATELRAHSGTIPASTFEPLCQSAGPPALRLLDLADNFLRADGVRMLCESAWAGSLTHLDLSRNYLDDAACELLARSGRFAHLRTLHLGGNNLHQEGGDGEQILDRGVVLLTESPSLANVRVLTLSRTAISDATVDRVLNAPFWRLSGLGVAGCDLTPAAVRYLAASPRLKRLNWLDVSHNPRLRGAALRPLAESPYLSRLCELDCGGITMDDDVRAMLRERLGTRFSH